MKPLLGFSRIVYNEDAEKAISNYRSCISSTLSKDDDLNYVVFSDSILIYTDGIDERALYLVILNVAKLQSVLISKKILVRGAISYGNYESHKEGSNGIIVAGPPIVDAYRYEKQQDWIGVMITPTVLHKDQNLISKRIKSTEPPGYYLPASTPWKYLIGRASIKFHGSSNAFAGYAVLPVSDSAFEKEVANKQIADAHNMLHKLKELAPDPSAQMKYDVTMKWLLGFTKSI